MALCAVALAGGVVLEWLGVGKSDVLNAVGRQLVARTTPEEVFAGRNALTILVLGCDEDRYYGGKQVIRENARSDMMLVARLDFDANQITGISIPRDLQVDLPGYRAMKINAYYSYGDLNGGPERAKALAKEAAEYVLGVPIDRVVVLNYKAFQEMVDLVGGVEMFVPKRMKYTDKAGGLFIDFKPGRQHMNGYDAMCFVRFRHTDSDFERQKRQKDFLLAFKDAVMRSPGMIGQVADKARAVMGNELTPDEVAALALFARAVNSESIKMGMVPVRDGRGSNLLLETSQLQDTLKEFHFIQGDRVSANVDR